jgi:hypothetical protein|eukprot:COSAG01_NODE_11336_length_1955_cov_1.317349_1_plen_51_part_00
MLWSLSDTPFSPFVRGDHAAHFSWPQVDASKRNLLLSLLVVRVRQPLQLA